MSLQTIQIANPSIVRLFLIAAYSVCFSPVATAQTRVLTTDQDYKLFYEDARYQAIRSQNSDRPWIGALVRYGEAVFQQTGGDVQKASLAMETYDLAMRQYRDAFESGKQLDLPKSFVAIAAKKGGRELLETLESVPVPALTIGAKVGGVLFDSTEEYTNQDHFTLRPQDFLQIMADPDSASEFSLDQSERLLDQSALGKILRPGAISRDEANRILKGQFVNRFGDKTNTNFDDDKVDQFKSLAKSYLLPNDSNWVEPSSETREALLEANPWYANDIRTKENLKILQKLDSDAEAILEGQGTLSKGQAKNLEVSKQIQAQLLRHRSEVRISFAKIKDELHRMHKSQVLSNAILHNDIVQVEKELDRLNIKVTDIHNWVKSQRVKAQQQAELKQKLGAFDSASEFLNQVGNFSGSEKVKKFTSQWSGAIQYAKKFEAIRERLKNFDSLNAFGKAAITMDSISLGLGVIKLLSGANGKPDIDTVILQELRALSKEMHERFDRIDQSLNLLHLKFDNIAKAIDRMSVDLKYALIEIGQIRKDLNVLSKHLDLRFDELFNYLREGNLREIELLETDFIQSPLDSGVELKRDQVAKAFSRFEFYANSNSRSDIYRQNAFPIRVATSRKQLINLIPRAEADPYASILSLYILGERLLGEKMPLGVDDSIPFARVWARASNDYLSVFWANRRKYNHRVKSFSQLDRMIATGESLILAQKSGRTSKRFSVVVKALEKEMSRASDLMKVAFAEYSTRTLDLPEPTDKLKQLFPGDAIQTGKKFNILNKRFPSNKLSNEHQPYSGLIPLELRAWAQLREKNKLPAIEVSVTCDCREVASQVGKGRIGSNITYYFSNPILTFESPNGHKGTVGLKTAWTARDSQFEDANFTYEKKYKTNFGKSKHLARLSKEAIGKLKYNATPILNGIKADLKSLRQKFAAEIENAVSSSLVRPADFTTFQGKTGMAIHQQVGTVSAFQRLLLKHLEVFAPAMMFSHGPVLKNDSGPIQGERKKIFDLKTLFDKKAIENVTPTFDRKNKKNDFDLLYRSTVASYFSSMTAKLKGSTGIFDPVVESTVSRLKFAKQVALKWGEIEKGQARVRELIAAEKKKIN